MSCYSCTKGFGILNREHACGKCGFGFCSNCVRFRAVIPGKGPKELKVCGACNTLLTNPGKVERMYAPPEALQKRLDSLESPGGPPVIVYTENRKMASMKKGLSMEDQKIVDRLHKLKLERKEKDRAPSDTEIAARLSKLKDENENDSHQKTPSVGTEFYKPPDKRSDVEKTRDLLEGISKEVHLDAQILTPEQDIAIRLAKLRGQNPEQVEESFKKPVLPDPTTFLDLSSQKENIEDMDLDEVAKLLDIVGRDVENEAKAAVKELEKDKAIQEQLAKLKVREKKEDDDADVDDEDAEEDEDHEDRLIKQILEEQKIEDRLGPIPDTPEALKSRKPVPTEICEDDLEPEELPWCVICNEDAAVRCRGCDDDLYCGGCYKEFHDGEDPREHQTIPFKNKSKK